MTIFGALGLALTIIVLKLLVGPIFTQLSATIIAVLHGAQVSADVASQIAATAASANLTPH